MNEQKRKQATRRSIWRDVIFIAWLVLCSVVVSVLAEAIARALGG